MVTLAKRRVYTSKTSTTKPEDFDCPILSLAGKYGAEVTCCLLRPCPILY
jgi:hypothetical protein